MEYWACKKILKNMNKDKKEAFKLAICEALIGAAKYMQKTFPINNPVLKYLSSLDPKCHGVQVAASAMKKLSPFFPSIIKEDEIDLYHGRRCSTSILLTDEKTPGRIDEWWACCSQFPTFGTCS